MSAHLSSDVLLTLIVPDSGEAEQGHTVIRGILYIYTSVGSVLYIGCFQSWRSIDTAQSTLCLLSTFALNMKYFH